MTGAVNNEHLLEPGIRETEDAVTHLLMDHR